MKIRTLIVACVAHVMHDGLTDLLYVMLPIWQREFGISLAAVGLLRSLYSGAMAAFQLPSAVVAERVGARTMLVTGTALAALCYAVTSTRSTYVAIAAALFVGGLGASVQHPISSNMIAQAFDGARSRAALGTYNFAGDLGKMAIPSLLAGLLIIMPWRPALLIVASIGLCVAAAIAFFAPRTRVAIEHDDAKSNNAPTGRTLTAGFALLLAIGAIDSATRTGFLTFLPFIITGKGTPVQTVGFALTLIFAGGAAGKFVCGYLGDRIGVLATVCITEGLTALGIIALLPLKLGPALAILPLIGVALNGTSSVLYGTVPELVPSRQRQRAFGIFYTVGIGSSSISPVLAGALSDAYGIPVLMAAVATLVLVTIPLAIGLQMNQTARHGDAFE
ncbi:MAG TPA: MFS transporter [Candidatus Acidoferrales bacterium]|nr:MFS transporter [Candidatus Acidoferrales bacterium]